MGIFSNMFKKKNKQNEKLKNQYLMLGQQNSFSFKQKVEAYKNKRVRMDVNKIAELIAVTPLKAYRRNVEGKLEVVNDDKVINLLLTQPNKYLNGYDVLKQWVISYLVNNNGYIWLKRNSMYEIVELYPVLCKNAQVITPKEAPTELFIKFTLADGTEKVVAYENVLHIRRNFGSNDFFGDNTDTLSDLVSINDELWNNVVDYTGNISFVKGFLQTQTILNDDDIQEARDKFSKILQKSYKGIQILDGKYDYKSINNSSNDLDFSVIDKVNSEVDSYFGINESILQGKADDTTLKSFHKLTLDPIFTAIEKELNAKILTSKEIVGWGHEYKFICNEYDHLSASEKTATFTLLTNIGAVTLNEVREAYGLERIPGSEGDALMYSKNFAEKGKTDETSTTNNPPTEDENIDNSNKENEENA